MAEKKNRSKSSNRWLNEHVNDAYVHMAQKDGYRARSAYKLIEINDKEKLIRKNSCVVDLGSAPGSWSQVAAKIAGSDAIILAMDILPMEPVDGVYFIQGDFTLDETYEKMVAYLNQREVDFVMSDMAPNMSGNDVMDQARSYYLCELALEFCKNTLKQDGSFLIKVFQGSGFEEYRKQVREVFRTVEIKKPKASRDRSNEVYLLARGFQKALIT